MRRIVSTITAMAVFVFATEALADPVSLIDSVPHIATDGHASLEVVPDEADIRLGVTNQRPTAEEAAQATARIAGDVIAEIKKRGIDGRDIRTDFSLVAQYDEVRNERNVTTKRTFRGYQSEERISVHLRDLSKAGVLARAFIERGANDFKGIVFSYSQEASKLQELKAEAIRNALSRAKVYTDAAGVHLGRVLQISENSCGSEAAMPARHMLPTITVAIPTEPGVQRLDTSITVTWEIEGKGP